MDFKTYKKARVRVTGCNNKHSWYALRIGEEFDVVISPNENACYIVDDSPGMFRTIDRNNAVIIDEEKDEESELINLIANLSKEVVGLKKRVKALESENTSLSNDIKTWAEETEKANYKAGQALTSIVRIEEVVDNVEMLIDDVVMLDERTRNCVPKSVSEYIRSSYE